MGAVLAAFLIIYGICAALGVDPSAAVLAAVLALTMARKAERPTPAKTIARLIALPLVAVGAGAVGVVLHASPWIGAALFCGGMFLSIWLRQFGERASMIGTTIALPLIAILIVPVHVASGRGRVVDILLVMAAGVIAVLCTSIAAAFGTHAEAVHVAPRSKPDDASLPVSTRMALQMLVALAASFAIGLTLLPAHWPWIVLTAFIVCSRAVGRGDALYKGLQRLAGAIGGTVLAALVPHVAMPTPEIAAIVIFAILFLGMWLRTINYAYWAVCATLLFALLQPPQSVAGLALFGARLECILIGAMCAVLAAWFVYPIETESIVRLRLATALGALSDLLATGPGDPERPAKRAYFEHQARQLDKVAPPLELHRRIARAGERAEHPATWIETARTLFAHGRRLADGSGPADPDRVKRAIGASRLAIRERSGIGATLLQACKHLDPESGGNKPAERTPPA